MYYKNITKCEFIWFETRHAKKTTRRGEQMKYYKIKLPVTLLFFVEGIQIYKN